MVNNKYPTLVVNRTTVGVQEIVSFGLQERRPRETLEHLWKAINILNLKQ